VTADPRSATVNEVEVIVDIRPNPGRTEWVVVKRKLTAEGGELHLVGEPTETLIGMATRRVMVKVVPRVSHGSDAIVTVRVLNVSVVPFPVTAVVLEWDAGESSLALLPLDLRVSRPLQPGDGREYYLSSAFGAEALKCARTLKPEQYWIAAYSEADESGADEVGRLAGDSIRPFLDQRVRVERRAATVMDFLSEAERLSVIEQAWILATTQLSKWPESKVIPLQEEPRTFLLSVPPDLKVFVQPVADGTIKVLDVVREDTLRQYMESEADGREG
jgi:hypothetical protein